MNHKISAKCHCISFDAPNHDELNGYNQVYFHAKKAAGFKTGLRHFIKDCFDNILICSPIIKLICIYEFSCFLRIILGEGLRRPATTKCITYIPF